MMAWRVAYCKVFYPLAYYCAYFSIRANAFDYEKMAMGRDKLEYFLADYKARKAENQLTNAEEDELKDMRIVQEMYARGVEFEPIDILILHRLICIRQRHGHSRLLTEKLCRLLKSSTRLVKLPENP